jgi:hypothetical protein
MPHRYPSFGSMSCLFKPRNAAATGRLTGPDRALEPGPGSPRWRRWGLPRDDAGEQLDGFCVRQPRSARTEFTREFNRAIADAKQAAHLEPHGLPKATHFTIAALVKNDPEGRIEAV